MKKIVIVIFDDFTDIDLFLMWDIFCRNKSDWQVRILGTKEQHRSSNDIVITTHGHISESNDADVVLFTSGKKGIKAVINDENFLSVFLLNPQTQLIGSICAGAFILACLGILKNKVATTHPEAKEELETLGIKVMDKPFICDGHVATAGGCLSAQYLAGWVIETMFDAEKRKETLKPILPAGQQDIYEKLITSSIQGGILRYN